MPASFFNGSSMEGEAVFTFTVNPLASRCFTQLPQHSQVVDFQTSMTGERESALAAEAVMPKERMKGLKKKPYLHTVRFLTCGIVLGAVD